MVNTVLKLSCCVLHFDQEAASVGSSFTIFMIRSKYPHPSILGSIPLSTGAHLSTTYEAKMGLDCGAFFPCKPGNVALRTSVATALPLSLAPCSFLVTRVEPYLKSLLSEFSPEVRLLCHHDH